MMKENGDILWLTSEFQYPASKKIIELCLDDVRNHALGNWPIHKKVHTS